MARAQADALAPVRARLGDIAKLEQPEARVEALKKLREDLPRLLRRVAASPELARALESAMGTAIVIGSTDAAQATPFKRNGDLTHALTT